MKNLKIFIVSMMLAMTAINPVFATEMTSKGTGSSDAVLNTEAASFSVTVPVAFPIHVDSTGIVTVSNETKIVNHSYGSVQIRGASIDGFNGWSVINFDSPVENLKVNSKQFGFMLQEGKTVGGVLEFIQANYPVLAGSAATNGSNELPLVYDAVVAPQKAQWQDEKIADVVFTVGWYGSDENGGGNHETPSKSFAITVSGGTANVISAEKGTMIEITADEAPTGKEFDLWTSSDEIVFTDETQPTTIFEMPEKAVSVEAIYKEIAIEEPEVGVWTFQGNANDNILSIIETNDGYVLAGETNSKDLWYTSQYNVLHGMTVKLDKNKEFQWGNTFQNASSSIASSYKLIEKTIDNGIIVSSKGYITKYDENGSLLWNKHPDDNGTGSFNLVTTYSSLLQLSDGSLILFGNTSSGSLSYRLVDKYDKDGNKIWTKKLDNLIAPDKSVNINGSTLTSDEDGFVAVGYAIPSTSRLGRIAKYDTNGNQIWATRTAFVSEYTAVTRADDGGFVAVGSKNFETDAIIVKYDANGVQKWIKEFIGLKKKHSIQ